MLWKRFTNNYRTEASTEEICAKQPPNSEISVSLSAKKSRIEIPPARLKVVYFRPLSSALILFFTLQGTSEAIFAQKIDALPLVFLIVGWIVGLWLLGSVLLDCVTRTEILNAGGVLQVVVRRPFGVTTEQWSVQEIQEISLVVIGLRRRPSYNAILIQLKSGGRYKFCARRDYWELVWLARLLQSIITEPTVFHVAELSESETDVPKPTDNSWQ